MTTAHHFTNTYVKSYETFWLLNFWHFFNFCLELDGLPQIFFSNEIELCPKL